jgi:hypothetical protein
MSLKRKPVAATAAALLVIAGSATGAAIAASGHGRSLPPAPNQLRLTSTSRTGFLRASATYLGTDLATLRHELKSGTLAQIANATPGRSEKRLAALLVPAAFAKLSMMSDKALPRMQQRGLHAILQRRITGFLNDTCPLGLAGLGLHLAGCAGMHMSSGRR